MQILRKAKRRILFAEMHGSQGRHPRALYCCNLFQEQELRWPSPLGGEPAVPSAPRWGGHAAPLNPERAAGIPQTFGTNSLRPPVPSSGTDAIPRH